LAPEKKNSFIDMSFSYMNHIDKINPSDKFAGHQNNNKPLEELTDESNFMQRPRKNNIQDVKKEKQ